MNEPTNRGRIRIFMADSLTNKRMQNALQAAQAAEKTPDPVHRVAPTLDLSSIMGLETKAFLDKLYLLALGRPPDENGRENYQRLLAAGMSKPGIAYLVCSSKEFAGRAKVLHWWQYRLAYLMYICGKGIKKWISLGQ